jgi:flagellar biosynthesis/type III secretory pathway M-ring protein FliF/YscJ
VRETIEEPVWLRELEAPMRLAELEREAGGRPTAALAAVGAGGNGNGNGNGDDAEGNGAVPPLGGSDQIRRQVEHLAEHDPDQVAQQLRSWMQED